MTSEQREAAIRILDALDVYVHMVIDLNRIIGEIMDKHIDERHVRKLAERDRLLRPLVRLRDKYERNARECGEAYRVRMAEHVN